MADPFRCHGEHSPGYDPPPAAVVWPMPDRVHHGVTWTPAERNVREDVIKPAQEAPDPIREGATPSRVARVQVATFAYDMGQAFGAEDFTAPDLNFRSTRQTPGRGMLPWQERANTAPPQHVAYGSLFQYDPLTYGFG